jgi:hypothetical protein
MDLVGLKTDWARTSHNILAVAQKITYHEGESEKTLFKNKRQKKRKEKTKPDVCIELSSIHLA